jgi:hypothetical protein
LEQNCFLNWCKFFETKQSNANASLKEEEKAATTTSEDRRLSTSTPRSSESLGTKGVTRNLSITPFGRPWT